MENTTNNQDSKRVLKKKLEEAKKERNEKQKVEKLRLKTELGKMEQDEEKKWWMFSVPDIIKQLSSILFGICFNWYCGNLIAEWVENWSIQYVATGFDIAIYWIVFISFAIYFGYYGIKKLEPFWNGVPTFLGHPLSWYVIPSGYFWQLPEPFMGFIAVNVKLKDLDIEIKKALSQDNVDVDIDALVQARVTDPYKWASVEKADEALRTLVKRNIRIYTNLIDSNQMPGQKVEFSRHLEIGIGIPVLDENGNKIPILDENKQEIFEKGKKRVEEEMIESVPTTAEAWGFGAGIEKCIINDIRLPEAIVKANVDKKVETAQVESETTQQNLYLALLGGGEIEKGREAFLEMTPEERSKNIQAERNKRKVITVDGNAGDMTKGLVSGATIMKGGGK